MYSFLNYLFYNLIFYRIYFYFEQVNNPDAVRVNLEGLKNDLISIGFDYQVSLSYILPSFVIAFLSSFVLYFFPIRNEEKSSINFIFNRYLAVFIYNSFSFIFSSYLLRMQSLSRLYILISLIIYPIFLAFIIFISDRFSKKYLFSSLFLVTVILSFTVIGPKDEITLDINNSQSINTTSENIIGFEYEEEGECKTWQGSENYSGCITGAAFTVLDNFEMRVANVIQGNSLLYILRSDGVVFTYDIESFEKKVFLDLSDKVMYNPEIYFESGLFSMSFHPSEEYFLISYSDLSNNLTVEKYKLENDIVDTSSSELIVRIPSSDCCHYSGNIIWSYFFEDFIVSVGDMGYKYNSINTVSPKGKLLLLNSVNNFSPPLISDNNSLTVLNNIIAYGLRNPWKTYEFNDKLFIPDIGFNDIEELNILNLSTLSSPVFYGWPVFEGINETQDEYFPYWKFEETSKVDLRFFAQNNTSMPSVYYYHNFEGGFRAAIIGGEVIQDTKSSYFDYYIFADYLSKELFGYDYVNDTVITFPLPESFSSYITSLIVDSNKLDSIFVTTGSGDLINISLP